MIIALMNLKGGSAKTTSAAFLSAALSEQGDTLLIDADPQGSATSWSENADLPFAVVARATKTLHRDIEKHHASRYDHIVIDCPPGDLAITGAALKAAEDVIISIQPTTADIDQLSETLDLIEEVQDLREGQPHMHILLTRVIKRTRTQTQFRELLESQSMPALATEIYQSQAIAIAHGAPIDTTKLHEYDEVLEDLQARRRRRGDS